MTSGSAEKRTSGNFDGLLTIDLPGARCREIQAWDLKYPVPGVGKTCLKMPLIRGGQLIDLLRRGHVRFSGRWPCPPDMNTPISWDRLGLQETPTGSIPRIAPPARSIL